MFRYDGYDSFSSDLEVLPSLDSGAIDAVEAFRDAVVGFLHALEALSIWYRGFG